MARDPLRSAHVVSESDAERLLTRAAAVDAQLGAAVPAELQSAPQTPPSARAHWPRILRIVGPVLGAAVVLVGGAMILNGSTATWLVRKLLDPVALGVGAAIAARLRVRPLALALAGFAVATGAEFLMDFWAGVPAVRGAEAHFALIIAGIGGVLLGARFGRTPRVETPMPAPAASAPDRGEADESVVGQPLAAHA